MTRQTRLSSAQRTSSLSLTQNTYTKYELQLPHFWNIAIVLWSCLPQLERRITFIVKINAPSFSFCHDCIKRIYVTSCINTVNCSATAAGVSDSPTGFFYSACALRKCLYLQVTTTHSQFSPFISVSWLIISPHNFILGANVFGLYVGPFVLVIYQIVQMTSMELACGAGPPTMSPQFLQPRFQHSNLST